MKKKYLEPKQKVFDVRTTHLCDASNTGPKDEGDPDAKLEEELGW